jgi:hypothetical protein
MEFESEIPPSGNPDSGKKQHALERQPVGRISESVIRRFDETPRVHEVVAVSAPYCRTVCCHQAADYAFGFNPPYDLTTQRPTSCRAAGMA